MIRNKNLFKNICSVINYKEIYLINTPLQFLNLIEYNYKYNYKNFDNSKKIFVCNSYGRELDQMNFINKKLKLKYKIINVNNKINKIYLIIICFLKTIIQGRFSIIIIGDYENPLFEKFFKFSKKIIILDDGTNIFSVKKALKKKLSKNSKYYFFSFFDKKFLNTQKYLKNDFLFLRSKVNLIKKKNKIIFLGFPAVERNVFDLRTYKKLQLYVLKKFNKNLVYYFPHPKETNISLKKTVIMKTIKSALPFELFLILNNFVPRTIVSHNSTAVILLKKIFLSKIKLINVYVKIKKNQRSKNHTESFHKQNLKIINYFARYLNIKTKLIK